MRTLLSFSFAPQTLCGQAGQGMTTGQRLKKKNTKKEVESDGGVCYINQS